MCAMWSQYTAPQSHRRSNASLSYAVDEDSHCTESSSRGAVSPLASSPVAAARANIMHRHRSRYTFLNGRELVHTIKLAKPVAMIMVLSRMVIQALALAESLGTNNSTPRNTPGSIHNPTKTHTNSTSLFLAYCQCRGKSLLRPLQYTHTKLATAIT